MIRRIISCIPNTITSLNLVSGCIAVFAAMHFDSTFASLTGAEWTCVLIGMAAIFDFCDGAAARLLHAYSDMGKELDSLADLVSFGIAPAALMLNSMLHFGCPTWALPFVLFIPVMGALRLARFNIDDRQTTSFIGLPIPGNAIFWIGTYGWLMTYGFPGALPMIALLALVSLAMVSNIHMFSLKFKNFNIRENFRRYAIILAAIAFVVMYGLAGLAWTIVLYVFISLLSRKPAQA